jgi:hypothetical protein
MRHAAAVTSHAPKEQRTNTIRVDCAATGPQVEAGYTYSPPYRQVTLADVEGFCARLRQLGAGDGLVLDEVSGLSVTLDLTGG